MMREAALLSVLLICAIRDARTRMIPNAYPLMVAACCLIPPATMYPGGIAVALVLLAAALIKGGVGGGDVKIVMALGLVLGFERTSAVLILAMVMLVAWNAGMKLVRRDKRAYPFVPFLFFAASITTWIW